MLGAESDEGKRPRQHERHPEQPRLLVEPDDGGREGGADDGEDDADEDVDPKERAHLRVADLGALDRGHGEPQVAEHHEKHRHGDDHGDEAEILGGEDARQNGHRAEREGELRRLVGHRDGAAAHGASGEVVGEVLGSQESIGVERGLRVYRGFGRRHVERALPGARATALYSPAPGSRSGKLAGASMIQSHPL